MSSHTEAEKTETSSEQTIAKYTGDMAALEAHIEEALDRQLKLTEGNETAGKVIRNCHDMVKRHRDALTSLQGETGSTVGNPIKAAGAAVLGKAAGIIDQLRDETISKALRDDYAAFSLAAISYSMLHTTALGLGDARAAALAKQHLTDYAGAIERINEVMPGVVERELSDDGLQTNPEAPSATRDMVSKAWHAAEA